MKGLIIKDICLLAGRKQSLLLLLVIGIVMGVAMDGSFVIGYMGMLTSILLIGTISYDEFDNGYPFLMTLPVTRKSYVDAKYLFCLAGGLAGVVIGSVICLTGSLVRGQALSAFSPAEAAAFIPVMVLIIAVSLPVQLKYGAERSRMVLLLAGGGCMVLGMLASRLFPDEAKITAALESIGRGTIVTGAVLLAALAIGASYLASLHIMNSKEF